MLMKVKYDKRYQFNIENFYLLFYTDSIIKERYIIIWY